MKQITISKLIISTTAFIILFGNFTFFANIINVYPINLKNSLFLLSLPILFGSVTVILLSLACYKYTIKPVLITVLLVSSLSAYFMDSYHVIIDDSMIDNIVNTDLAESLDLISFKQFLYFLFLGIAPSTFIYRAKVHYSPNLLHAIYSKLKIIGIAVATIIVLVLVFGSFYASFFREHKPLRFYANPSYYLYSIVKYVGKSYGNALAPFRQIGLDSVIPPTDEDRELIIFVVGETARSDHFSLNGYDRQTNPYLEKQDVISYKNFWSCGTSTAVSVPCMFSMYERSDYSKSKANSTENVLDVLQRAGVNVIWLDNNSNSKGVALRVPYESFKAADKNPVCDIECRDIGMLENLQQYIDDHPSGDIFIVLHQKGNHGPAYFKRYPKEFEKFIPACQTNQLEDCTQQEIINAYDNAILYTDYFLSRTIALLNNNSDNFETALFYASDHGESLGENNLYLHGLPYLFAPDAQTSVPVIMWFGGEIKNEINFSSLKENINNKYSHDNIFHTLLGLMEVQTSLYEKDMDLISHDEDD